MNTEKRSENQERLKEILAVLRKYEIVRGVTPEKLCAIIQDLGPTFVKLGQILSTRSDVLPERYCNELKKLRSNVQPMPFSQVSAQLERAYGRPLDEIFAEFDETALGSASIAQAHAAVLKSGERVVAKVQREGIHEVMSRDIQLMKQACKLEKYIPVHGLVDLNQLLDEMWVVAQQEMNFQTEAGNLERFHQLNEDVAFVTSPRLYRELTTTQILVMERIDGIALDNYDEIKAQGYDLTEIGTKLADNYIKQIMEDGFFHADPHPGNIRIQDGKIVWLDMGMMGSLSDNDRTQIVKVINGIANHDISACREAVMHLGKFTGKVDKRRLSKDIEDLIDRYGTADLGSIDIAAVLKDMTEVMKNNGIMMPPGMTMLARGLGTIEGVIADLAPGLNIMQVVTSRIGSSLFKDKDWKGDLMRDASTVRSSAQKSLEIPALLADSLRSLNKGEVNISTEHHTGDDTAKLLETSVFRLCAALVCAALIICGGLTWKSPLSIGCFVLAAVLLLYAFWIRGKLGH